MERDNQEVKYCADDVECRIFCAISDKLCIEPFYKNHLKSGTHITNIRKRQQSIIMNKNYFK